jgi:hypothetical protein
MSVKVRGIGIYLAIFAASWLAVRSLAASPEPPLEDPPVPLTSAGPEIPDPALSRMIARFAADARRDGRPVAR